MEVLFEMLLVHGRVCHFAAMLYESEVGNNPKREREKHWVAAEERPTLDRWVEKASG